MLTIHQDIILIIGEYLTDCEKIQLTMVSRSMDKLKHKFMYCEIIKIAMIKKLPYFNNFERVKMQNIKEKCPKYVEEVHFKEKYLNYESNKTMPNCITHLTLEDSYIEYDRTHIPSSVTHLTFGQWFDHDIKKFIPPSVTHLTFGTYFNASIKNNIPPFHHQLNIYFLA